MHQTQPDHRIMMLSRDRVFYRGWLGRAMQPRRIGAAVIYCAPEGSLRIRRGRAPGWQSRTVACVLPYEPHELATGDGHVIAACFEPERIAAEALETLVARVRADSPPGALARRLRHAATQLAGEGIETPDRFDRLVLGAPLPERALDPRIVRVLDRIEADPAQGPLSAEECAAGIGLSASRFLHLFKDETGISFRNLRMWKRARRFLDHAVQETSLTEVALDLGYPDSSHFSHSIRKIYGLMPRSIREGSRGLTVIGAMGPAQPDACP